jgi:RNA polymerase sigma-70 factor, ECF subfamily
MSVAVPLEATAAVRAAEAAALLYEHHHGRILAFCLRRLRNREEAEDAAQQTFLKAFGAMRGGFRPAVERAWLYRIAENVCADRGRANGRRVRHEAADGAAVLELIPARDSRSIEGLDEALAELTPAQRQALLLREWQGLSYREIATELELSQSAVETLLFRARRSLAKRLEAVPLIPWLKSMLFGAGGAKTVAAVAVTVGVGTAAVAPLVVPGSSTPAPPPARSVPANAERVGDVPRSLPTHPRAVAPTTAPARPPLRGTAPSAPATTPTPSAPSSAPPVAAAHHAPKASQLPVQVPVPAPKSPAPPLPAPPLPELPVEVPSVPVPEVKLPQTGDVPVLGPVLEPVLEPVQQVVDSLPATLP